MTLEFAALTRLQVVLGGGVAYVPQSPWIVNATVKENITFGEPEDSGRSAPGRAAATHF